MKKVLGVAIACAGATLASMALVGCGTSASPAAVLLCVGRSPVERAAFSHWVSAMTSMSPAAAQFLAADASGDTTARQRARQFLIRATRIAGEAREQGLRASAPEVAATLEPARYGLSISPAESTLASALRSSVETRSDRLLVVTTSLLAQKLEQSLRSKAELEIPQAQLASYYSEHGHEFVIPERRDVGVVQSFEKPNADLARRELEAGRSVREVVQRRNQETDVGGMKRNMTREKLGHPYERDYFSAKPHVIVGPRKFQIFYLFEVTAIKPRHQQSLQEVEPIIRRKLISGPNRNLLTAARRALDEKWAVTTRCGAARS